MTRTLLLTTLLLTAACGELASNQTPGTTLATVHGKLAAPSASSTAPVGMTIFWYGATSAGNTLGDPGQGNQPPLSCPAPTGLHDTTSTQTLVPFVSQAVVYQPHFPIDFSIPVTQVPPTSAQLSLSGLGGTGSLALGFVVAFEDTNGNGVYDFGTPTLDPEPIIATSSDAKLLFLDGHLTGSQVSIPGLPAGFDTQGFSVLQRDATGDLPPGPASTPVPLSAATAGLTRALGCQTLEYDRVYEATPPAGANVSCLNATGYLWDQTSFPQVCHQQVHVGVVCLGTSTPPSDWPCH